MKRIKVIEGVAYIERLDASGMWRKIWKKLFRNWIKLMDKYFAATTDLPYWHGENANTSFLAAAAWKSGGVAIEQFYAERKKGKSKGHSDLWISFNGKKDFDVIVEAKRDETSQMKKIEKNIRKQLIEANKNLKDLDKEYRRKRLVSICFCFPRINKKKRDKFSKEKFIKKITKAFEKEKNVMIASYFPKPDMKKMTSHEYENEVVVYFGVLLVARIEK